MKKLTANDSEMSSPWQLDDAAFEILLVGRKVKDDCVNAKVAEARQIRLTWKSNLVLCRAAVMCQSFLRSTLCQAMNITN